MQMPHVASGSILAGMTTPAVSPTQTAAPAARVESSAAEEAAKVFLDAFEPSGTSAPVAEVTDPDRAAKESLIRDMVRRSPDPKITDTVVEALSAYPLEAIRTVSAYGTRIELYDFDAGDAIPSYLPTLGQPGVVGAYNTKANVLGFDRKNADTFTVLHEFAHALDGALNEPSQTPEWRGAHTMAKNTNCIVRDYAKVDVAEYLAESTTAYLVADANLPGLVDRGIENGALGLSDRQYMQMCQNLSNERLHIVDRDGWALVDNLLHDRLNGPHREPRPAMTEAEWTAFRAQQDAEKKAQAG